MKIASNKINDVVRFFYDELNGLYEPSELDTIIEYCFEEYLGIKRNEIKIKGNDTISESELLKFNFAVKDLKAQKPIQYILGKADFYGLKFSVNEYVLIPRPETEELVDLIIKENKNNTVSIMDIGTGSGCIAIALKKNMPASDIVAIDISEQALQIAEQNANKNNTKIKFNCSNIFDTDFNPQQTFDIIVSNPPYICISEKQQMQKNVLDYEPHLALFVEDSDPLLFYRAVTDFAIKFLKPKGKLYFEINQRFGDETKSLLENKGFKNVVLRKDINDKNRTLQGNS